MIVVPTLPAGFLLKSADGSKGEARFKDTVQNDFAKAVSYLWRKPDWDERVIWSKAGERFVNLFPTVEEVFEFFRRAVGKKVAADVETTGEQPLDCRLICIGFATEDGDAICVPVLKQHGEAYWTTGDWDRVRALLKGAFATSHYSWVFHNGSFDILVLLCHGFMVANWTDDTLLLHHCIDGELPHSLGYVTSRYLEVPYYKDDVKGKGAWLELDDLTLRSYNCLHGSTSVILEDGRCKPIKWLVRTKYAGNVRTADGNGVVKFRPVIGWHRSRVKDQKWIQFRRIGSRWPSIVTPDHRVAVWDGEVRWKLAENLKIGDQLVLPEIAFSPAQRQALLGTILGDSSLPQSPVSRGNPDAEVAGFECVHTDPELVKFKAAWLNATVESRSKGVALRLNSMVQLAEFRSKTWVNGERRIPIEWLDQMGPRGMAWWFADDGCLQKGKQRSGEIADSIHLALCRYPETDQILVRDWFQKNFGTCSLQQGSLCMGRIAAREFAKFIGPFLPPSARYKLPRDAAYPKFNDDFPQHGWTALIRKAIEVGPYTPTITNRGQRMDAETRWCIDVDSTHTFFTPQALVHNCRDVLTTIRALPIMLQEAQRWNLEWLYHREVKMAQLMVRATLKGLLVDLQRRDDTTPDPNQFKIDKKTKLPGTEPNPDYGYPLGLGPKMRRVRAEALSVLQSIAKDPNFNPASPIQLQKVLYDQLKFPVVKRSRKTQKPSSDKDAMVLLSLHATPGDQQNTLRSLAKYRRADKLIGTYVEGLQLLGDGRLHVSWKVHGTVSGRFSSSPNAQNLNGAVQRIFQAGPGADFVGVDLSQAEVRGIAYQSGDPDLLLAYEKGLNVHTVNATLLFQLRNPGEDTNQETENYLTTACPATLNVAYADMPVAPASKWKRIRRLAKNFVFAANYGAIPETIFDTLRAERDPDTDEPLFPDLDLGLIEALKHTWETLHPSIPKWWKTITTQTKQLGHYQCPITGRIRWFRGGFKQNEMINFPIQCMVASHMDRMIEIGDYMYQVAGDEAMIVAQVHDAIVSECHKKFTQAVKDIYMHVLNKPFPFGNYPTAVLPADEPKVGRYLNDV